MKTLIQDNFSEHLGDKLTIVSNASVHLNNDISLGAWQIHATGDKKASLATIGTVDPLTLLSA